MDLQLAAIALESRLEVTPFRLRLKATALESRLEAPIVALVKLYLVGLAEVRAMLLWNQDLKFYYSVVS